MSINLVVPVFASLMNYGPKANDFSQIQPDEGDCYKILSEEVLSYYKLIKK